MADTAASLILRRQGTKRMAIVGIGTDIVDVARIQRLLDEKPDELLSRVYTEIEINYCRTKKRPAVHYAARFAAKEAFMKAIGTGWAKGVGFSQIGVVNDEDGAPSLTLTEQALICMTELGATKAHITASHTDEFATATVILESTD
ncbi:holo-ACP synthase [Planctomycetota bacterium]|nr:holo-ACP synthase [Planctomycetota bacterium]